MTIPDSKTQDSPYDAFMAAALKATKGDARQAVVMLMVMKTESSWPFPLGGRG